MYVVTHSSWSAGPCNKEVYIEQPNRPVQAGTERSVVSSTTGRLAAKGERGIRGFVFTCSTAIQPRRSIGNITNNKRTLENEYFMHTHICVTPWIVKSVSFSNGTVESPTYTYRNSATLYSACFTTTSTGILNNRFTLSSIRFSPLFSFSQEHFSSARCTLTFQPAQHHFLSHSFLLYDTPYIQSQV